MMPRPPVLTLFPYTTLFRSYAEEYGLGSKVEGTVSKITDKGLFVKLDLGVNAFISADKLEEKTDDLSEAFKEGDKLEGFVVERSEEHTSELQSRGHLVCRLL